MEARGRRFREASLEERKTVVLYREEREAAESDIPRRNPEIYVCPFYSYLEETAPGTDLDRDRARTGCLIHPARTGQDDSQNYSFYGASICGYYDCPNKERDVDQLYSRLLERHFPDQEHYSRLMADPIFYSALMRAPEALKRAISDEPDYSQRRLAALAGCRLLVAESERITSFEVKRRIFATAREELLHCTSGAIGRVHPGARASMESPRAEPARQKVSVENLARAIERFLDITPPAPIQDHALESTFGQPADPDR